MTFYSYPEFLGLTPIAEIDLDSAKEDYGFDITAVWHHAESGKYYVGHDTGCSCPSPFEDFHSLEDFDGPFDWHGAIEALTHYIDTDEDQKNYVGPYGQEQEVKLVQAIEHLVNFRQKLRDEAQKRLEGHC